MDGHVINIILTVIHIVKKLISTRDSTLLRIYTVLIIYSIKAFHLIKGIIAFTFNGKSLKGIQ